MKLNRRQVIKAGLAASTVYSPWMLGIAQSKPVIFGMVYSGGPRTPDNLSQASQDYIPFINDSGGINGRKFEVVRDAVNNDPTKSLETLNRILTTNPDTLALWTGSLAVTEALAPEIKRLMIPVLPNGFSAVPNRENHPSTFLNYPTAAQSLLALLPEIKRQKSNATVTLMFADTITGKDPIPAFKAQAANDGIRIVTEISSPLVLDDAAAAPFAAKLVEANPDFVVLQGYFGVSEGTIVKVARAAGLKSVMMCGVGGVRDHKLKVADGFIASNYLIFHTETNNPGFETIRKVRTSKGKETNFSLVDTTYLYEWALYSIVVEAARRADAAGKLTRQGIIETLENNMGDFNAGGLHYSLKFINRCLPYTRLHRFDAAKELYVPITNWMTMA